MNVCRRYRVSGFVQGVGFRYYTQKQAVRIGVTGWVRNLAGGGVEVVACGDSGRLEELHRWLEQGPPSARVIGVRVEDLETPQACGGFTIR